jgi:hypothetical protein
VHEYQPGAPEGGSQAVASRPGRRPGRGTVLVEDEQGAGAWLQAACPGYPSRDAARGGCQGQRQPDPCHESGMLLCNVPAPIEPPVLELKDGPDCCDGGLLPLERRCGPRERWHGEGM